jgi:hypothetical protein
MTTLSARTQAKLRQAGWYPGRQIDTQEYETVLRAEGYPVHQVVIAFLREFGGISLSTEREISGRLYIDTLFHFDAGLAAIRSSPGIVESYYNLRVEAHLCAIGETHQNHVTLFMDCTGRVYGGYDEGMVYYGENGEAAIEALCWGLGQPVPEGPLAWEDR